MSMSNVRQWQRQRHQLNRLENLGGSINPTRIEILVGGRQDAPREPVQPDAASLSVQAP